MRDYYNNYSRCGQGRVVVVVVCLFVVNSYQVTTHLVCLFISLITGPLS